MIQVIHRALDILEFIGKSPERPKSISEISESLGLHAATCANIIKTLVDRKYLGKLDNRKGYILGNQIHKLTNFNSYENDLIQVAQPIMKEIVNKIKENTLLGILDGNIRKAILHIQSSQDIQAVAADEVNAYQTSAGRLLVSYLDDDRLTKFINRYGLPKAEDWPGIKTKKALMDAVNQIRSDGYVIQASSRQIVGLSVPIIKKDVNIASLSVYLPTFRFKKLNKEQLIREMKGHSNEISKRINF